MNHPMSVFPFSLSSLLGQQADRHNNQPPARIRAAMEFLQNLSQKTMSEVAANDVGFETIDGQKLTTAEANAQASACHLLSDYFLGTLELDRWEKTEIESKNRTLHNCGPGTLLTCIVCGGSPKPDCVFCRGMGHFLVFPTSAGKNSVFGD